MSVEPGEGGQKFIYETVKKVEELNKFIYENGYETNIVIDGGINNETAKEVVNKGANVLVSGNFLIKSDNLKEAIKQLKVEK